MGADVGYDGDDGVGEGVWVLLEEVLTSCEKLVGYSESMERGPGRRRTTK